MFFKTKSVLKVVYLCQPNFAIYTSCVMSQGEKRQTGKSQRARTPWAYHSELACEGISHVHTQSRKLNKRQWTLIHWIPLQTLMLLPTLLFFFFFSLGEDSTFLHLFNKVWLKAGYKKFWPKKAGNKTYLGIDPHSTFQKETATKGAKPDKSPDFQLLF